MPATQVLEKIEQSEKKTNPTIWIQSFKDRPNGLVKVWFPTLPRNSTIPMLTQPAEEIKDQLIHSKELPTAVFPKLVDLKKLKNLTDPDLRKLFHLIPIKNQK